jgi:hypothetical protein
METAQMLALVRWAAMALLVALVHVLIQAQAGAAKVGLDRSRAEDDWN